MRTLKFLSLGLLSVAVAVSNLQAQGTRADYRRSAELRKRFSGKVFRDRIRLRWFADDRGGWYQVDLGGGKREFVLVDIRRRKRRAAFDHEDLAEALTEATGKEFDPEKLPLEGLRFSADRKHCWFRAAGKGWLCERDDCKLQEAEEPKDFDTGSDRQPDDWKRPGFESPKNRRSPDGAWEVFVKEHDLHLRNRETGSELRLSHGGDQKRSWSDNVFWAPDSKRLVAYRTRRGAEHTVHMVESSPEKRLQPKLHSHQYLKPGDEIPLTRPHLFDVSSGREIPVSDKLFSNPWRVRELRWNKAGDRFTFRYNQRGHQVLRLIEVNARSGVARAVIEETSKTFLDYAYKQFLFYLDDTNELLWMSERDGWNHLYLYDARSGKVKNQVTRGHWVVRGIERIDVKARQLWFRASGLVEGEDPYHIHFCRIDFDGSNLVRLTSGDGTHQVRYSPGADYLVDSWSRVDRPPVTELRSATTGRRVCRLERSDISALEEAGWQQPERFRAAGRDGRTGIWGVIYRPSNFDDEVKYPVIEKIYAGPHGSFVPKSFRSSFDTQVLAELGFIVVQIDGMGTSNRSKAFHDVCHKNLGDSGFPDRILWMRAAAKTRPWMDLSRVGIFGGSAGGQSSLRGMLVHGDFYKVAVSVCGCHDNRMDKIWWNELWMGWPIGPHYAEQSNVTQAHRLSGQLLLIVGELDRNVDPASTMQVVNALIKADKDFDFLLIPGGGHGIGGSYGVRRRQDYFVRHLWGVQPRRGDSE
ncbi:MAG TPA: peptidase S9 [Planctomycetaceae bacterium]|nr:peptidase S9 [Planctomycetaceae bacterium]